MSQTPSKPNTTAPQIPLPTIPNHPLAAIAGKFQGELWEETLHEIQQARQADREYWRKVIKHQEQQNAS